MRELMHAFRRDLSVPRLPVAMVQIARVVAEWDPGLWNSIQRQQRRLPDVIPYLAVVPAIDLPLDDLIHIGGDGNTMLGRRLAEAMHAVRGGKDARLPRGAPCSCIADKTTGLGNIVVEFDNVVGRLVSGSRPTGFSLDRVVTIFDTVLAKDRVILRTLQPPGKVKSLALYYGQGTDPYCNITDAAGRPLLAFGWLALGTPLAMTPFVKAQVMGLLTGAELDGLTLPESLTWRGKLFSTEFCNLHDELGPTAPADKLVYFRCDLDLPESMQLVALLGYDGPVKLWLDGRKLFHDPTARTRPRSTPNVFGSTPHPASIRSSWRSAPTLARHEASSFASNGWM